MPVMHKGYFTAILAIIVLLAGAWYVVMSDSATPIEEVATTTNTQIDMALTLRSNAFEHEGKIPGTFTCDENRNLNPQLSIVGVPAGAQSLVLIMDDPDIAQSVKDQRGIDAFDHWILFNIPPATTEIPQGTTVGVTGANGVGVISYMGPCPPKGVEPSEHAYSFRLYALDTMLGLAEGATKKEVQAAMQGRVLEETELIGRYERK